MKFFGRRNNSRFHGESELMAINPKTHGLMESN